MAKQALIQRELKREKLAAKYAAKYTELKAIASDSKKSDGEREEAKEAKSRAVSEGRSPIKYVLRYIFFEDAR